MEAVANLDDVVDNTGNKSAIADSPSLSRASAYINTIDFSKIIDKLVKYEGWFLDEAHQVCRQYRNFLFLNKKYGDRYAIPPTEEIDEFWHMHILDTKAYRRDCEAIFGKYLDHYPYFGIDEKSDINDLNRAFKNTLKLYQDEFGESIEHIAIFPSCFRSIKRFFTMQGAKK